MPGKAFSTFLTRSPSETIEAGRRISKIVKPGTVICLSGELGAGKTTLLKGIAGGLGIKQPLKRITSSSFVLVREFPEKRFYHVDLFRLDENNFFSAGIDQYIDGKNIVAIEWSDIIRKARIRNCLKIRIEMLGNDNRKIEVAGLTRGRFRPALRDCDP